MDASLYGYQALGADTAWERLRQEMEHVKDVGGCFTLLWHNATFDDADLPGYGELYWACGELGRRHEGAWMAPWGKWHGGGESVPSASALCGNEVLKNSWIEGVYDGANSDVRAGYFR